MSIITGKHRISNYSLLVKIIAAKSKISFELSTIVEMISWNINFEKMFKIMLTAMRVNRSHPAISRDRQWACQFLIMHGLFFMVFCLLAYSTIFHDIKKGDFAQACANGILGVVFFVVTYKYCVMVWYQDLLKGLMDEMCDDYISAESFCENKQKIVLNFAKKGKKVVELWFYIAVTVGSIFLLKPLSIKIYYSAIGDPKIVHIYDLTYPSPVEERKNQSAVYCVLFFIFLFYDLYAMVMYIAMSALGPVFMLHACGQLDLVRDNLMNIFNEYDSEKTTMNKLNDIVKHLQKIYSFVERVKKSFRMMYELTLKAAIVLLPISFYQVIDSFQNGDFRIEFIMIILGGISLSSIPCYYSDNLMDMGENVRLAAYMSGWEAHLNDHKAFRNTLLLIQSRALRPVAIRTMFRVVSLDALTDVYHHSYAVFNVLNAAWH